MPGNTTFFAKAADMKITWRDIFSDVFKKHSKGDGERLFIAGTSLTTPHESRMIAEWKKPWLFARVGIVGIAFVVAVYAAIPHLGGIFQANVLIPLLFISAIVMPLAIVLFFMELNIPRNIPIYHIMGTFILSGVIALGMTAIIRTAINNESLPAHILGPFPEEPARLVALIVCMLVFRLKSNYILGGLLIGATVGMGFAVFENIGYTLNYQYDFELLLMRSSHAAGTHVLWSTLQGAGLALAMGHEKFHIKHLFHVKFLSCFGIAFGLHFVWNHPFGGGHLQIPIFHDIKYVVLSIAAWVILLFLVKQGVKQCMRVPQIAPAHIPQMQPVPVGAGAAAPAYAMSQEIRLRGLSGIHRGNVFPSPGGRLIIGRDNRLANVVYPPNTPGISSVHCEITYQNGVIYLTDKNSSNGTFLADGTRLAPERPHPLARKGGFYLATRENMFEIE